MLVLFLSGLGIAAFGLAFALEIMATPFVPASRRVFPFSDSPTLPPERL